MSPSSLWAWHSYSWLCFLPSPRGQLSCKCPVSGENCTASRLRERLMATLLARTASLPSLSEPAASGESARSRRRDSDRWQLRWCRIDPAPRDAEMKRCSVPGSQPPARSTKRCRLHADGEKRHPVALVSKLVTRNSAVQPFRGEQPAHQHISSEDPDQTQQYARESKCRHTQDHDNLHEPEPTFDHLIEREDTLGALSNGDIWRVAPPARVSPPPAARSVRQRKIVSDESWRRRIEVGSPPTQGGRIRE